MDPTNTLVKFYRSKVNFKLVQGFLNSLNFGPFQVPFERTWPGLWIPFVFNDFFKNLTVYQFYLFQTIIWRVRTPDSGENIYDSCVFQPMRNLYGEIKNHSGKRKILRR